MPINGQKPEFRLVMHKKDTFFGLWACSFELVEWSQSKYQILEATAVVCFKWFHSQIKRVSGLKSRFWEDKRSLLAYSLFP